MTDFTSVIPRLPVTDLHRTMSFYTERLGFALSVVWPDARPTFCILDRGTARLSFFVPEPPRDSFDARQAALSLEVSDVHTLHEQLRAQVPVEWGPEVYWYGRREFAIRDPDGYMLIFSEETDDPPTCVEE